MARQAVVHSGLITAETGLSLVYGPEYMMYDLPFLEPDLLLVH